MGTYFITGGYGFLGQYIVQAVHDYDAAGELRVLIRSQRKTRLNLERLDRIKWTRGELTDPATFAEQLKGVDTVIHSAAMVSFKPADRQKVFDANVVGTRNISKAARDAGCKNFVFVSSFSAVEFRPPQVTDESFIPDLAYKERHDIYGYTKRLSELELIEMAGDMRVVILNPTVILGPGSERVDAAMNALRKTPIVPMMDYINSFVDVRDVARAITLAITKGRSAERYLVSAHNARMVDFTRSIVKYMGQKKTVFALSPVGVQVADGLVAMLDLAHLNPGIRRPGLINVDKPCSSEKIRTEMGWVPAYSLDESIKDSVASAVD